jgi:hypothetical protein
MGLLDTEVFPRTNLYDINVYVDEEDFLRITAYHLVWVKDPDSKHKGDYTFSNDDYLEPISLLCLDLHEEDDLARWGLTRHAVNRMSDSWTTTSEFHAEYADLIPEELMNIVLDQIEKYCPAYTADVQEYSV